MTPRYVLIGPPGSGKTTVGKALADKLGLEFRDTDVDVAERAGKSIAEIFVEDGEPIFRQFEETAVANALREHSGVLALGGGAIMSASTQEELEKTETTVIFLDVSISAASPRIGLNRDRPLLLVNPRAQWLSLMEKRRPIYERLADITIVTDEQNPSSVAEQILERV